MRRRLGTYVNGNTIVAIYSDGTKERYIPDDNDEPPVPEFPESIDLKITNRCNACCEMCAESSTPDGDHANLDNPMLLSLHPYTELAIGGGNPLEHPDLVRFLTEMNERKVICNLTVNAIHLIYNHEKLEQLCDTGLIKGLGISVPIYIPIGLLPLLPRFKNAVIHTIAGYTPMHVYEKLADRDLNLLILGFKNKGHGEFYMHGHPQLIASRFKELESKLPELQPKYKAIAFDNLAVRQLHIKNKLTEDEWNNLYMGDDGEYTMYIDLVEHKAGRSSSHPLFRFYSCATVDILFRRVQEEIHSI